jgi:hypothetical protein
MAGRIFVIEGLAVRIALRVIATRIREQNRRRDALFQLDGVEPFLGLLLLDGLHVISFEMK